MIRHIVDSRPYLSLILTLGIVTLLIQHFPFPDDNAVLQLIGAEKPGDPRRHQIRLPCDAFLDYLNRLLLFRCSIYSSFDLAKYGACTLPLYARRNRFLLMVGALHHPKRPEPVVEPRWMTIPDRGLYTGIAFFGANRLWQHKLLYLSLC